MHFVAEGQSTNDFGSQEYSSINALKTLATDLLVLRNENYLDREEEGRYPKAEMRFITLGSGDLEVQGHSDIWQCDKGLLLHQP